MKKILTRIILSSLILGCCIIDTESFPLRASAVTSAVSYGRKKKKTKWYQKIGKALGQVAQIAAPVAGAIFGGPAGLGIGAQIGGLFGGQKAEPAPFEVPQDPLARGDFFGAQFQGIANQLGFAGGGGISLPTAGFAQDSLVRGAIYRLGAGECAVWEGAPGQPVPAGVTRLGFQG